MARCVIDSNVLISHLLLPDSRLSSAVRLAFKYHNVLMSDSLLTELRITLSQKKFSKYISLQEQEQFLYKLYKNTTPTTIVQEIRSCRDIKDNHILELAVNGRAHCIITGDKDLLVLHPFRNITIYNATDFLKHYM